MKRHHANRMKLAGFVILVVLFIWLRWYSTLWENRWTGFVVGIAFVILNWRVYARQQLDLAHFSKRAIVLLALAVTWMAVSGVKSFLVGPPFFFSSGVRAASDNGFFAVLMCMCAVQWLYASWAVLRRASDQSSQNAATPLNHG